MDKPFCGIRFLLVRRRNLEPCCPAPLSDYRSRDVNIDPGSTRLFHRGLGLFTSPESLFTCPESLFTSSRNLYSHAPEYAIWCCGQTTACFRFSLLMRRIEANEWKSRQHSCFKKKGLQVEECKLGQACSFSRLGGVLPRLVRLVTSRTVIEGHRNRTAAIGNGDRSFALRLHRSLGADQRLPCTIRTCCLLLRSA